MSHQQVSEEESSVKSQSKMDQLHHKKHA